MPDDYVITVRSIDSSGNFSNDPGPANFLIVPNGMPMLPSQAVANKRDWADAVITAAGRIPDGQGNQRGDILVFIHGYNNSPAEILGRHRTLLAGLTAINYTGTVVSFDWPCSSQVLAYIPDRIKANQTAYNLVTDCITLLASYQQPGCNVNVHLLAHSTGAYVIREAFDDADDRSVLAATNWTVSQIALISGDVSADSLGLDNPTSESLYRHCVRLTNYSNAYDSVLSISDVKRIGVAPRVGRVGLPTDVPANAVNVNCSSYFKTLPPSLDPTVSHHWQFSDPVFTQDLLLTIQGDLDRNVFPTRQLVNGQLVLVAP